MRVAWFRPRAPEIDVHNAGAATHSAATDSAATGGVATDTTLLIRALQSRHTIDLIDATRAHDFVWRHARQPWDLCVFELGGSPAHQFIGGYAAHYPGLVLLRGLPRHDQALVSARLVVVPHEPVAQLIADDYPGTRVRTLIPGVEPFESPDLTRHPRIIEALRWPPDGAALTRALSGFASSCAVIVFDGPETADWPSFDPQNWLPRAPLERRGSAVVRDPICVSIDPRDEAHSLQLARKRLDADPALCERLGRAAHTWWSDHATVALAVAGFEKLLEEAQGLVPPATAAAAEDGTSKARKILYELGIVVSEGSGVGLLDLKFGM